MRDVKVSIIVPVYNAAKYLADCVQSILDQSFKNFEILLIDDGSGDESRKICDQIVDSDSRIKVFYQEHSGVSAARNRGLKESRGEYICFVDADDMLKADFLDKMVLLLEDENIGMGICLFESIRQQNEGYFRDRMLERRELLNVIVSDDKIGGYVCNKIFRNKLIQENGIAFNENTGFLEDELFTFTYAKLINQAAFLNERLYFYRVNPSSACQARAYHTYQGKLSAIENILSADTDHMLNAENVSELQKSYSGAGVWLNIYMFREGIYDKEVLKEYLQCAKKYYFRLSFKHKLGYWGLKMCPKIIYLYCRIFGYKGYGKK